jgi:hypothetical protein
MHAAVTQIAIPGSDRVDLFHDLLERFAFQDEGDAEPRGQYEKEPHQPADEQRGE